MKQSLKIAHNHLLAFSKKIDPAMESTSYTPNIKGSFHGIINGETEVVSLTNHLHNFGEYGAGMPNEFNHLYLRLRTGLMLSYEMINMFDKRVDINRDLKTKRQKVYASNVLMAIIVSRMILESSFFQNVDLDESVLSKVPKLPQFDYSGITNTRNWMIYYVTKYLEGYTSQSVNESMIVIKSMMTQILSNALSKVVAGEVEELNPIIDLEYEYEGAGDEHTGEIHICLKDWIEQGVTFSNGTSSGFEFITDITFDDMVGNEETKLQAKRGMDGLLCYDPVTERNPFADLGGYQSISLYQGIAGVGKSMLTEIMLNYLHRISNELGIKVIRNSFEKVQIDSYQGKSEQSSDHWFEFMNNGKHLYFADVDDGENKLRNRGDKNTSEGVRGVVASFLRNTEGAGSPFKVRNNILMPILTNLPEAFDPAVLSRIKSRVEMTGAVSLEDFMDLMWLQSIRKNKDIYDGIGSTFWDIEEPVGYKWMSSQKRLTSIVSRVRQSTHEYDKAYSIVDELIVKAASEFKVTTPNFFGRLHDLFKDKYQQYSPRDVRNVHGLIGARLMDFDFPSDWSEDLSLFYMKDYDTKKNMLLECSVESTKGKSYSQVSLEEITNYMVNFIIIMDKQFNREVAEGIKELRVRNAITQEISKS